MLLDPSRWQIRCFKCGRTRATLDAGIVRLAPPLRKYTLAWCSGCRWLRFTAVEPMPGFEPLPVTRPGSGEEA